MRPKCTVQSYTRKDKIEYVVKLNNDERLGTIVSPNVFLAGDKERKELTPRIFKVKGQPRRYNTWTDALVGIFLHFCFKSDIPLPSEIELFMNGRTEVFDTYTCKYKVIDY